MKMMRRYDIYDRLIKKMLLLFLVLVVTAAGFSGFFSKWAFRDGSASMGIEAVLDGTAERPFVYRQLLPQIAKRTVLILPDKARDKLSDNLEKRKPMESIYSRAQVAKEYNVEYYLVFLFSYGCFFAAIWQLRILLGDLLHDKAAGTLTALLFALLMPFLEQVGGYYYDFPELLFMTLGAKYALRGNWLALTLVIPLAVVNKEAYFFFLPTLYPFAKAKLGKKQAVIFMLAGVLLAGLTYLYIKSFYTGNPGGMVQFHLMNHIKEFAKISTYFLTSTTYGLPLGSRMFFLHVIFTLWISWHAWKSLTDDLKQHVKIALVINIPLYWLFCYPGELRNLSLLYISFCVLLTCYIHNVLKDYYLSANVK